MDSDDPMAAVHRYVDAFNNGDQKAMAAACADPMQILDGMSPHVWQGPTANDDWYSDVLTEGEHLGASGYHIELDEPNGRPIHGGASQGRRRLATFRLGLGERQVSPTHTTTGVASFGLSAVAGRIGA